MHGRVKERTTEEKRALIAKQHAIKAKAYREGIDSIFSNRKLGECDQNTLTLISKLLGNNPDIYTLWNIRREILLNGGSHMKQEDVLNELRLTEECLRINPKSYSAWHHRCWVLDNCPNPDWQKEVDLCARYLKLDERNFHCWNYRRFVVQRAEVEFETELKFSTEKILHNFSNYSSWHYRSVLYKTLSPKSDLFKEELDLVQNACFTDPTDTSAWFYQRWILGKSDISLKVLMASCSNSYVIVSLTNSTNIPPILHVNEDKLKLKPFEESSKLSKIWACDIPNNFNINVEINEIRIEVGNDTIYLKYDSELKKAKHFARPGRLGVSFQEEIRPILIDQLASCRELLELEPDSKWTLLTTALLLRGFGGTENNNESISMVEKLIAVDPLRIGYYKDLRSQWIIDDYFNKLLDDGSSLFTDIVLIDPSITALYNLEYFIGATLIKVASQTVYDKLTQKFNNRSGVKVSQMLIRCKYARDLVRKVRNPPLVTIGF